jgi:hypothetical protein
MRWMTRSTVAIGFRSKKAGGEPSKRAPIH